MQVIRCVLSGSYRRDYVMLERDYRELIMCGCQVLSPHRLDFENNDDSFVKDVSESDISIENIEMHHLLSIKQSDFVWLHCPEGYLGLSAAMEIGYASALNTPVFCKTKPREKVFESFVTVVDSVFMAIESL